MHRVFPVLMLVLGFVVGTSVAVAYAQGVIDLMGDVVVDGTLTIQDGTQGLGKVFTSDSVGGGSWQGIPGDGDSDPTNELQSLSLAGQDLTISSGNTVTLPSSGPADNLGNHMATQDLDMKEFDINNAVDINANHFLNRDNTITGTQASAVGGSGNTASGDFSTVGGGESNNAIELWSTVGGGLRNTAGAESTVGGGIQNRAEGESSTVGGGVVNTASGDFSTVGGGSDNTAGLEIGSTVGGGQFNIASGQQSTIGGGRLNMAEAIHSTVAGGNLNRAEGETSTVGGGQLNIASKIGSTVGGGIQNTAEGIRSTVAGGTSNRAGGDFSTVGGGDRNVVTGDFSTVPGGAGNFAQGFLSFAAGGGAKALHDGTFVWADSFGIQALVSTVPNQFLVRAVGGTTIASGIDQFGDPSSGVILASGKDGWASISDNRFKDNISEYSVLDKLDDYRAIEFDWKSSGIHDVGVIGQELESIFPELVNKGSTEGDVTSITDPGVWSVQYSKLGALALQAIKEQQAQIDEQNKVIDSLIDIICADNLEREICLEN